MVCPHCQGAEKVFNEQWAQDDLDSYRKNGPAKTTRLLLDALREAGVAGLSLLDIGGGIGAVQLELLMLGVADAVYVDASTAYLRLAQAEAEKRGYAENIEYVHGDFVQIAADIEAADIVTLDRVICCYPDMRALVNRSSQRAKRYYGLVYPRDNILTRWGIHVFNFFVFRLWGNPFRNYIHSSSEVDAIVRGNGLTLMHHRNVGLWQVFVYER